MSSFCQNSPSPSTPTSSQAQSVTARSRSSAPRGNAAAAAAIPAVASPDAHVQAWLRAPADPALRAPVAGLAPAEATALSNDTLGALLDAALPPGSAVAVRVARGLGVELAVSEQAAATLARPTADHLSLRIEGSIGLSAGVAEGLLGTDAHGRPIAGQLISAGAAFTVDTMEQLDAPISPEGLLPLLASGVPVVALAGPGATAVLGPALAAALPGAWSHQVAVTQSASASATQVLDRAGADALDEAGEDDPGWLGRALRELLPDAVSWGAEAGVAARWEAGPAGNSVTLSGALSAVLQARWEDLPFIPDALEGPAAVLGMPTADELDVGWDAEGAVECTVGLDDGSVALAAGTDCWEYPSLSAFAAGLRGSAAPNAAVRCDIEAPAPDPLPVGPGWAALARAAGLQPGVTSGLLEARTAVTLAAPGAATRAVRQAPDAPSAARALAAHALGAPLPDWAAGLEATLERAASLAPNGGLESVVATGTARAGIGGTVDGGALLPVTGTAAATAGQTVEIRLQGAEARQAARRALGGPA